MQPFLLFCTIMKHKLKEDFYLNTDVCFIAKALLGKELVVNSSSVNSGIITETEAYAGITDKASHAWNNRRTKRTETMYLKGGVAYVYLCYGIHYLFNVVTNYEHVPDAVLIRSIFPKEGIPSKGMKKDIISGTGPGRVSKILGIDMSFNKAKLTSDVIFILDNGINIPDNQIVADRRIGVDYAGEDALLPYRYYINRDFLTNTIL